MQPSESGDRKTDGEVDEGMLCIRKLQQNTRGTENVAMLYMQCLQTYVVAQNKTECHALKTEEGTVDLLEE